MWYALFTLFHTLFFFLLCILKSKSALIMRMYQERTTRFNSRNAFSITDNQKEKLRERWVRRKSSGIFLVLFLGESIHVLCLLTIE